MRWLFVSVVAGLACSPQPAPVDAGRLPVDAGPPRVVDGGVVGPFSRGRLLISQTVREEATRTTASFAFSATFTEVAAGTPNPCIERREGACKVRICNQGERVEGTTVSPGTLTLEGLLPVEVDAGRDAGPVDAGNEDGGARLTLSPNDAGLVSFAVTQRLFFGGTEVTVQGQGGGVPAFTSPLLVTPAQLSLSTPRCMPACAAIPRDLPFRVAWANVSDALVSIQLSTSQVSVTCEAPAEQAVLEVPTAALAELTPSVASGDATLFVLARRSVHFDAGTWDVTFSAETPTLFPVIVLP
jgi:hypothetical protein